MIENDKKVIGKCIAKIEFAESLVIGDPSRAFAVVEKCIGQDIDESLLVRILLIKMESLWRMTRFEEAIELAKEIKEKTAEGKDIYAYYYADTVVGNIHYDLGDKEKALEYYMKGLTTAKVCLNKKLEAALTNNIGEIYNDYGAFEEAQKYYLESIRVSKEIGDMSLTALTNLNVANLYFKQGNIKKANDRIETSLSHFEETENYLLISDIHLLKGNIFRYKKEYDLSHKELEIAIKFMKKIKSNHMLASIYLSIIELLMDEEKYEEAIIYGDDVLGIAKQLKNCELMSKATLLLAKIYESSGKLRKTIEYYKMYSKAIAECESIQLEDKRRLMTIQLNMEESLREKEVYRLDNIELKEKTKEIEALNKKLSALTYIDDLTNIPNRRSFVDYINREIKKAKRKKVIVSMFIIDIDYFKEYNDHYGHIEGDRCLKDIASILNKSVKESIDFVARYGGDEFVVVLSDSEASGIKKVAERIVSNVRDAKIKHEYGGKTDYVTVSIGGISGVPGDECTMEELIRYADKELYVVKHKGRDGYSVYNEMEM